MYSVEYFQRVAAEQAGFRAVDQVPDYTDLLQDLQHGNFALRAKYSYFIISRSLVKG